MAKKNRAEGVYRVIDVIGTSKSSWEDAAKQAVLRGKLPEHRVGQPTGFRTEHEHVIVLEARVRIDALRV